MLCQSNQPRLVGLDVNRTQLANCLRPNFITRQKMLHRMKFYVVGIGPGAPELMTPQAHAALQEAEVIAGYGTYLKLIKPLFPGKEYLQTGMTGEVNAFQSYPTGSGGRKG